jgi:tetratricopeptide (TPR) repeat protein
MTAALLVALWLQAAPAPAPAPQDPAAEGMKALDAQRYEDAARLFSEAVTKAPEDISARFHLGLSLSLLHRDPEAIAAYNKVLELQPGLYEAQLNLGVLLLRQKQPAEAVVQLEAARKQKPAEFRPNYYMGEAYIELQQYENAEAPLRAAVAADAKQPAALLALGRSLALQGRVKESAPWYESAAKEDASFSDGLLELAALHEKAGNREEAIAIYKRFPDNPGARERLGVLLLNSGEAAGAVEQLEAAVKSSPSTANRFALATAYLKAGQNAKAQPLIEAALAAEPANVDLRLTLGRIHREAKNLPAAAQEFLKAAQADPKSSPAWNELASTLFLLGNYPGALAAFDRLKAAGEEKPFHLYLRALCYDRMQQYKEALPAYEKFLAASNGQNPEEEFKARQRLRVVKKEVDRR